MYYVNENIKNLYRVKFHDERKDYLRLDMNENPEGLPADFVEEIKKKINSNLSNSKGVLLYTIRCSAVMCDFAPHPSLPR